jgi:hypothetical protein
MGKSNFAGLLDGYQLFSFFVRIEMYSSCDGEQLLELKKLPPKG